LNNFITRELLTLMIPALKSVYPDIAQKKEIPRNPGGRVRGLLRKLLFSLVFLHALFIGITSVLVACYSFVDPPVTVLALVRKYDSKFKIRRNYPVKLSAVPRAARRMLVSVEDGNYWTHFGIDFEAVKRAVEINKNYGKIRVGGSTLTMQLARTLFLVPDRNYLRKYLEVIVTFELELLLSKERILELYLSWAEWGKGIFGIDAASRYYFGKPAYKLEVEESARLVALLSSPIRYNPDTFLKSGLLRERYQYLMAKYGS